MRSIASAAGSQPTTRPSEIPADGGGQPSPESAEWNGHVGHQVSLPSSHQTIGGSIRSRESAQESSRASTGKAFENFSKKVEGLRKFAAEGSIWAARLLREALRSQAATVQPQAGSGSHNNAGSTSNQGNSSLDSELPPQADSGSG